MVRWGQVIDLKKCVGCMSCVIVCKVENFTRPGVFWSRVIKSETGDSRHFTRINLPLLCMHCKDAPCEAVCPTGATQHRSDGIVWIDPGKCIGCKYCIETCPYGARYFNLDGTFFPGNITQHEKFRERFPNKDHRLQVAGTVSKCVFCMHRVDKGLEPACVANCPSVARYFGDLDDPKSEVSRLIRERGGFQLNPEFGTDPSVYYLPPR